MHRERVLLVGGQRALVMQLAHPKVAAGVARNSDFPARALERLRRTLDLTLATVFGTPAEAEEAAASIRAVHGRVVGEAGAVGRYDASDPELLVWVNATLVDTTMAVYERFVGPLPDDVWRRYYDESLDAAVQFGIPQGAVPPDLHSFRAYMREMLAGRSLRATDDGRRLVRDVLKPPLPFPWRPPTAAVRLVTLALIPDEVRRLFGLHAGPGSRAALAAASRASRAVLPLLPPAVREFSRARSAA
ncbi:MAG TPA: oxygenase MpaB family protein [Actinomycetota bacterium]|nr:oxygenase MpaB family protein [Actinomycetota bacterium]